MIDRVVQYPNRYNIPGLGDVTLTAAPGIITAEGTNVNRALFVALADLQFFNTVVTVGAWASDATFAAQHFNYRATIPLSGVLDELIPSVTFAPVDAYSGNLMIVAKSYDGGIYIYAKRLPTASITIPTIELRKPVSAI